MVASKRAKNEDNSGVVTPGAVSSETKRRGGDRDSGFRVSKKIAPNKLPAVEGRCEPSHVFIEGARY